MSFYPSQDDLNLLFQATKSVYSKVEILNRQYTVVDSIEGQLIDDDYSVDSNSNVRRTYSCRLQITESSLDFNKDNYVWFDKYIRPYVGIYDMRRKTVVWYLKGTYCSVNASQTFDAENNTLSLTCNDLMCRLTGDQDGKQQALTFTIWTGENIRSAIIEILSVFRFTKYNICELPRRTTYDLTFSAGTTAYAMIESLMQFCPNYEFFFDIDGTFVVQRIPCYTNDTDTLTNEIMQRLLVSQDTYSVAFNAKNCAQVWGKSYDSGSVDRMAESCTYSGGTYTVKFGGDPLTSLPDYLIFGVTVNAANAAGCRMTVKDSANTTLGTYTIYDDYDETLSAGTMAAGTTYLFCFDTSEEIVAADEMTLKGAYSASTSYKTNDVVMTDIGDGMKTYIARPSSSASFSNITPSNTSYWKEIVFATAFELKGMYSSNTTYQPTEMVGYSGKLYYCLKKDIKGVLPTNYNPDDPTWEEFNMNINYIKIGNVLRYRGHMTVCGEYKNTTDSKFSIESMGKEYWEIYSGGEYDNITSDQLAVERAMYECYYKANLNEALNLTLLSVPWLDVNTKVSYKRKWYDIDEPERWMINTVSSKTLEGTCSVTLNKFYPDWSEVFQSEFGAKGD